MGRGRSDELETCFHSFAKFSDVITGRRPDNEPQLGIIRDHYSRVSGGFQLEETPERTVGSPVLAFHDPMDALVWLDLLPQGRNTGICEESGIQGVFAFPWSRSSVRTTSEG